MNLGRKSRGVLAEVERGDGRLSQTSAGSELTAFLLSRLAEAESTPDVVATRRIVSAWTTLVEQRSNAYTQHGRMVAFHVFQCLAAQYADHPDYRSEWAVLS